MFSFSVSSYEKYILTLSSSAETTKAAELQNKYEDAEYELNKVGWREWEGR